jgi:hypothetical protein
MGVCNQRSNNYQAHLQRTPERHYYPTVKLLIKETHMNTDKSSSLINGVAMSFLAYFGVFLTTIALAQEQATFLDAKKKANEEIKKQESHPENPVDQFKSNLNIKKLRAQSQIELCKIFPNDCHIKPSDLMPDSSLLKEDALAIIKQKEFLKSVKLPDDVYGDKTQFAMEAEMDINADLGIENKKLKDKYLAKFGGQYEPKPLPELLNNEMQKAIDEWEKEMGAELTKVADLKLQEKISLWEDDATQAQFEEMRPKNCKDSAIQELLALFKDDKQNVLGKQFELTAIKTALLLKKDVAYGGVKLKSLEDYVNKQQGKLLSDEKMKKLKIIYGESGEPEDTKKLEGITKNIKAGKYSYYDPKTRILNSDVSAFYLLMDKHEEEGMPSFGKEDAAVAWAFGKLAERADKKTVDYSKLNLSNQVNKLMDARVAGGTDTPVEDLEKMQKSHEGEINNALTTTLKSKLSADCLKELGLEGDEVCDETLVDVKTIAFGKMLKDVSDEAIKANSSIKINEYYGEVKDFIGKLSPKPIVTKTKTKTVPDPVIKESITPDIRFHEAKKDNTRVNLNVRDLPKPLSRNIKKPNPKIGTSCRIAFNIQGVWTIPLIGTTLICTDKSYHP